VFFHVYLIALFYILFYLLISILIALNNNFIDLSELVCLKIQLAGCHLIFSIST